MILDFVLTFQTKNLIPVTNVYVCMSFGSLWFYLDTFMFTELFMFNHTVLMLQDLQWWLFLYLHGNLCLSPFSSLSFASGWLPFTDHLQVPAFCFFNFFNCFSVFNLLISDLQFFLLIFFGTSFFRFLTGYTD